MPDAIERSPAGLAAAPLGSGMSERLQRVLSHRLGLSVFLTGGFLVFLTATLTIERSFGYHSKPRPPGRALGVRVGGDLSGVMGQRVRIELVQLGPAIIAVHDDGSPPVGAEPERPDSYAGTRWYAFPSGRRLTVDDRASIAPLPFDFDGDGVEDQVVSDTSNAMSAVRIEVLSGATGAVLYRYDDPQEYAQEKRGFPLGDLDGDGYAELALLHPRCDRSMYDMVFSDTLLGARSWLSIVSGKAVHDAR